MGYDRTTTATPPLRQRERIEIDISEYITTVTTPTTGVLQEIIEEIMRMYIYIHSCHDDPRRVCENEYLEKAVVDVRSCRKGRSISIEIPENYPNPYDDPVVDPKPGTCDPSDFDGPVVKERATINLIQIISELARKDQAVRVSDLVGMDHDELEVLEALNDSGWAELKGGWWKPPRRNP